MEPSDEVDLGIAGFAGGLPLASPAPGIARYRSYRASPLLPLFVEVLTSDDRDALAAFNQRVTSAEANTLAGDHGGALAVDEEGVTDAGHPYVAYRQQVEVVTPAPKADLKGKAKSKSRNEIRSDISPGVPVGTGGGLSNERLSSGFPRGAALLLGAVGLIAAAIFGGQWLLSRSGSDAETALEDSEATGELGETGALGTDGEIAQPCGQDAAEAPWTGLAPEGFVPRQTGRTVLHGLPFDCRIERIIPFEFQSSETVGPQLAALDDGRLVAQNATDVVVIDPDNDRPADRPSFPKDDLAINPSVEVVGGDRVVVAGGNLDTFSGTVVIWDPSGTTRAGTVQRHDSWIREVVEIPGEGILSIDINGVARFQELSETGLGEDELELPMPVTFAVHVPDPERPRLIAIVEGEADASYQLVDLDRLEEPEIRTPLEATSAVIVGPFGPNLLLARSRGNGTFLVIDPSLSQDQPQGVWPDDEAASRSFLNEPLFLGTGMAATADFDEDQLVIWEMDDPASAVARLPVSGPVSGQVSDAVALSDGRIAIATPFSVQVWNLTSDPGPTPPEEPGRSPIAPGALAVLDDGTVVTGHQDGSILLWGKGGGAPEVIQAHESWVTGLAVLGDGRVASAEGNAVHIFDPANTAAPPIRKRFRFSGGGLVPVGETGLAAVTTDDDGTQRLVRVGDEEFEQFALGAPPTNFIFPVALEGGEVAILNFPGRDESGRTTFPGEGVVYQPELHRFDDEERVVPLAKTIDSQINNAIGLTDSRFAVATTTSILIWDTTQPEAPPVSIPLASLGDGRFPAPSLAYVVAELPDGRIALGDGQMVSRVHLIDPNVADPKAERIDIPGVPFAAAGTDDGLIIALEQGWIRLDIP